MPWWLTTMGAQYMVIEWMNKRTFLLGKEINLICINSKAISSPNGKYFLDLCCAYLFFFLRTPISELSFNFWNNKSDQRPTPSCESTILSLLNCNLCQQHKSVEKAMAHHSSTLAWKIPWTGEPGGLQSMGLLRVGHDWATSLSLFTFMHGRRKRQPTPVFLPGESQGRGSQVGCHLCGRTESDTTETT